MPRPPKYTEDQCLRAKRAALRYFNATCKNHRRIAMLWLFRAVGTSRVLFGRGLHQSIGMPRGQPVPWSRRIEAAEAWAEYQHGDIPLQTKEDPQ